MSYKINIETQFREIQCYTCGGWFAVTEHFHARRVEDGEIFYCPSGHGQQFTESVKVKLERANSQLALERDQRAAAQVELTKLKERIGKGVCPCCKRSFVNLKRHMQTKHKQLAEKSS